MKEIAFKILRSFIIIIALPFLLIIAIGFILYTPIDFIKYRMTRYYKDTKEKYIWMSTMSYYISLYDIIKKADLPIEFFRRSEVSLNGYGSFVYKNFLILNDYDLCYDSQIYTWTVEREEEYITVEESVKQDIKKFNDFMKADIVNRAVILVYEDEIFKGDIPEFTNCEVLLTSQSDTASSLQSFISKHA